MAGSGVRTGTRNALLVVMALALVQWIACSGLALAAKRTARPSPVLAPAGAPAAPLPAPVAEMRDALLTAVRSGDIEDLRIPLDWNEMKPAITDYPVEDPIAYWRKASADGQGREILAALGEVLDAGYTVLPLGKDVENNRLYVWPAIAEKNLDALSAAEEVELYRLVRPAEVAIMRAQKRWSWYRLVIGADGTWHAFQKAD